MVQILLEWTRQKYTIIFFIIQKGFFVFFVTFMATASSHISLEEEGWGLFMWLQCATSPLNATKSYILDL